MGNYLLTPFTKCYVDAKRHKVSHYVTIIADSRHNAVCTVYTSTREPQNLLKREEIF